MFGATEGKRRLRVLADSIRDLTAEMRAWRALVESHQVSLDGRADKHVERALQLLGDLVPEVQEARQTLDRAAQGGILGLASLVGGGIDTELRALGANIDAFVAEWRQGREAIVRARPKGA